MPINVDRITQAQGSWEPQRQTNWILTFRVGSLGLDNSQFYIALKSFPYPKEANEIKRIRWFNESRAYAGSVSDFGPLTLQVRDYLDQTVAQKLLAWRRLVWNPTSGNVGLARNYKASGALYLAPPGNGPMNFQLGSNVANAQFPARTIFIQGAWPSTFDMGSFDMDNTGDQVMVSCDISIDRAFPGDASGVASINGLNPLNLGTSPTPSLAAG
jgi:hypothetical protein